MKENSWITLFTISFILCALLYVKYDNEGYHYGLGCHFCKEQMPYSVKPYDGPQFSFVLKDENDFELVGIGFRYRKNSFKIKDFLAYGYNDTSIVAKCTDSLNTMRYLISYETGYRSKKGNPEISFKDLDNSDFERVRDKYQWFDVDEKKADVLNSNKSISILGFFLSLALVVLSLLYPLTLKRP
jgi:hypothetical protein